MTKCGRHLKLSFFTWSEVFNQFTSIVTVFNTYLSGWVNFACHRWKCTYREKFQVPESGNVGSSFGINKFMKWIYSWYSLFFYLQGEKPLRKIVSPKNLPAIVKQSRLRNLDFFTRGASKINQQLMKEQKLKWNRSYLQILFFSYPLYKFPIWPTEAANSWPEVNFQASYLGHFIG